MTTISDRTPELHRDDQVTITISNARVAFVLDGVPTFALGDGEDRPMFAVPVDHAAVHIRRTVPADGEPQAGDLWRDAVGALYFAKARVHGVYLCPSAGPGPDLGWESVHAGPTGPIRLEYRPADDLRLPKEESA